MYEGIFFLFFFASCTLGGVTLVPQLTSVQKELAAASGLRVQKPQYADALRFFSWASAESRMVTCKL